MINFSFRQSNTLSSLAFFILATLLLEGCGGDRTAPYTPVISSSSCSSSSSSSSSDSSSSSSDSSSSASSSSSCSSSSSSSSSSISSISSSSSSSSAVSIVISNIWSGTTAATTIEKKEKDVQTIRNETAFKAAAVAYIGNELPSEDFDEGQVVLVDDGEVDSCSVHLEFNKIISAVELTDNTVRVTVNYVEKAKQDKCTPSISRPFSFYYLKTTKLLIKEEKIVQ